MKRWQIIVVILTMLVLVGLVGCSTTVGGNKVASEQLFKVRKGALTVSVSGTGNIEASEDAKLSFGVSGRIEKIYIEEGDKVSKGDILAKLDTDTLELALTQAQVALTGQQVAVTQAGVAVTKAEVALRTAEHSLDEARDLYTWPDIKTAQADVDDAEAYVEYVATNLAEATSPGKEAMWEAALIYAQARLTAAEAKLDAKINSYDTEEVVIKKMEVTLAQQSLELAQQSLEQSRETLKQAERALEQAQKNLDKATITAPFDGVVADVVPEEGDTVNSATQIIYLVDPATMELVLKMDEMDVPGVMLNQEAIISVDSLPGVNFKGRVTSIYPTPTVVGGVVLYKTKISFDVPDDSGIKVGMSATADIVVSEANNVMLVPKQAIEENEQGETQVSVMVNGQIQKKPVVIGISDGIYTEILSGLSEGESVIINSNR